MIDSPEISEECKAYEKFALDHWQDNPFPMVKHKLIRYIKVRARCSTFVNFITNLEKHPLHGPEWFMNMSNDADIQRIMKLAYQLWPRQIKQCRLPIIGLGVLNEKGQFESFWSKIERQTKSYESKVKVIEKPGGKKGFMVVDDEEIIDTRDEGTSASQPITIEEPSLTPFHLTLSDTKALLSRYNPNLTSESSSLKKSSKKELLSQFKSIEPKRKNRQRKSMSPSIQSRSKSTLPFHSTKGKRRGDMIPSLDEEENRDDDDDDSVFDFDYDHKRIDKSEESKVDQSIPEPIIPIKLKSTKTERSRSNEKEEIVDMDRYIEAWFEFNSKLLLSRLRFDKTKPSGIKRGFIMSQKDENKSKRIDKMKMRLASLSPKA
ncbi:uncharacterized protein BX663DRAFT_498028 [Cokeromyces recurvatus]|uniref:uncharacterized protein n=1 Tax=Cokeromyces recurvatus TaxID=90255 RepID=UPI00221EE55B|nr:uncharacterized protein BX663DRAFT_498028 [Cokeromyces recurvatus]KAI7905891.1 hypothetical protein BX663DRAFT_498028 [Cokeromyces recurvatus]